MENPREEVTQKRRGDSGEEGDTIGRVIMGKRDRGEKVSGWAGDGGEVIPSGPSHWVTGKVTWERAIE